MSKIFDAHSHYMPPDIAQNTTFFKVNWSDIDGQLKVMDQNRIEKALLLYPTSDAHLNMGGLQKACSVYNEGIGAVVKKHPSRFIGAGIIPIDHHDDMLAEMERMEDLELKVISLASSYDGVYLDHEQFFPIYEFSSKNKLPIHVHPQIINPIGEDRVRDPLLTPVLEYVCDVSMSIGKLMMTGVFLKFPEVKFIFAHYGGVLPLVKERYDNTYLMLRKRNFVKDLGKIPSDYFRNLYFDTSGSRSLASLLCALEVADLNHILWGSDFPANQDIEGSIAVIKNAPHESREKEMLFSGNLEKLLCL